MRRFMFALGLALLSPLAIVASSAPANAQESIKVERVTFRPGTTGTVITRTIRGREIVDYLVNARAGQRISVSMTANNKAAYFNVNSPGEADTAWYVGSMSSPENSFSGTIMRSGNQRIRVYLYRNAARRGERAQIRLNVSVTGQAGSATQLPGTVPGPGGTATQLPGDALVPGTNYHATGSISCVLGNSGPSRDCRFGIVRRGGGSGDLTVTRPGGGTRMITFERGTPVRYDQSQADPGPLHWTKRNDETVVRIGAEHYTIPDGIIFGG